MGPQKLGYDIIGREGLALSAKWGVEGPKTYEGYCSQGFPNLFMQNAPQGTFTSVHVPARLRTLVPPQPSSHAARVLDLCRINFVQQLDEVSRHFAHIISGVKAAGKKIFDVKPEAEAKYIELMSDLIRF